jgi:hypothetical protein
MALQNFLIKNMYVGKFTSVVLGWNCARNFSTINSAKTFWTKWLINTDIKNGPVFCYRQKRWNIPNRPIYKKWIRFFDVRVNQPKGLFTQSDRWRVPHNTPHKK